MAGDLLSAVGPAEPDMSEPKKPMLVRCEPCGHVWPVVWTPIEMRKAARALSRARCPICSAAKKQIFLASKADAERWHREHGVAA